jgi:hypothetical protein
MSFYVPALVCVERPATLTLSRIGDTILPQFGNVAVVHSVLHIEGITTITWESYILPGRGEIHSKTEKGTYYYGPDDRKVRRFAR